MGSNEYGINVVSLFMAPDLSFKCVIEGRFQSPDLSRQSLKKPNL